MRVEPKLFNNFACVEGSYVLATVLSDPVDSIGAHQYYKIVVHGALDHGRYVTNVLFKLGCSFACFLQLSPKEFPVSSSVARLIHTPSFVLDKDSFVLSTTPEKVNYLIVEFKEVKVDLIFNHWFSKASCQ